MIKTYLLLAVTLCWAVGATMLSYDRVLVWGFTKIGHTANKVVAHYQEPVLVKEVVKENCSNPFAMADALPPLPLVNNVLNRAVGE